MIAMRFTTEPFDNKRAPDIESLNTRLGRLFSARRAALACHCQAFHSASDQGQHTRILGKPGTVLFLFGILFAGYDARGSQPEREEFASTEHSSLRKASIYLASHQSSRQVGAIVLRSWV